VAIGSSFGELVAPVLAASWRAQGPAWGERRGALFFAPIVISRQESRVTAYTDVIIVSLHICSRGSPANMSYKDLSIGKKIAAVFAVIAVINAVFGLFLASELRGVRDRVLNFTDSTLPSVLSVENLLYDVSYVRRAQFALLMVEDAVDQQARRGRIQESVGKVQRAMDAYEATVGAEHERQGFNRSSSSGCTIWGVNQVDGCCSRAAGMRPGRRCSLSTGSTPSWSRRCVPWWR
jgi:hypothetical protein